MRNEAPLGDMLTSNNMPPEMLDDSMRNEAPLGDMLTSNNMPPEMLDDSTQNEVRLAPVAAFYGH